MKNWEYAAGKLWPILTESARVSKTITYSEIAPVIETNPLSVGLALGPIQAYCLENKLPPLTAIVVGKNSGLPGGGFVAWDIDDLSTAQSVVFNYNWGSISNPYAEFNKGTTTDSLANDLIKNPNNAELIYSRIKNRGVSQIIFRKALLTAYKSKCAICGLSFEDILEAAHIKSWGECLPNERISINNGILLCPNHHKLWDNNWISINDRFEVEYIGSDFDFEEKGDKFNVKKVINSRIVLPDNQMHWPNIELLKRRVG